MHSSSTAAAAQQQHMGCNLLPHGYYICKPTRAALTPMFVGIASMPSSGCHSLRLRTRCYTSWNRLLLYTPNLTNHTFWLPLYLVLVPLRLLSLTLSTSSSSSSRRRSLASSVRHARRQLDRSQAHNRQAGNKPVGNLALLLLLTDHVAFAANRGE